MPAKRLVLYPWLAITNHGYSITYCLAFVTHFLKIFDKIFSGFEIAQQVRTAKSASRPSSSWTGVVRLASTSKSATWMR